MYPDFLHGAPTPACAAFMKESRMKFANAKSSTGNPETPHGKPGQVRRTLAPVQNRKGRLGLGYSSRRTYLRLTREGAVFPVIGHTGVSEDEPDQIREAGFRTDVVGQNDHASLAGLDADHGVGGLTIMAALEEAVALRAVEDDDAEPRSQILSLLFDRQAPDRKRETGGRW